MSFDIFLCFLVLLSKKMVHIVFTMGNGNTYLAEDQACQKRLCSLYIYSTVPYIQQILNKLEENLNKA